MSSYTRSEAANLRQKLYGHWDNPNGDEMTVEERLASLEEAVKFILDQMVEDDD